MKSNLNKTEFKKRLTDLTSIEKPIFFFTSVNTSGKPFCGDFDDKAFELTRNSFWSHVKAIVIKGEYKDSNNKLTEVTYKLGWTRLMKILFMAINCIAFIGLNALLILNRKNIDYELSSIFLTLNGVLIFGNLWLLFVNWMTKKIVNQKFKEEFEIGIGEEL